MQKYNFAQELEKSQEGMGRGNSADYFNIESGNQNLMRVLTPAASYVQYFLGKGVKPAVAYGRDLGDPRADDTTINKHVKYACYVLDRKDNRVKLATLPYSVMKGIADLQQNPDYAFEDLPMPYDVRITYKPEESPANKYSVAATPTKAPLTADEEKAFLEAMSEITPEQFVQKMKDKQRKDDEEKGLLKTVVVQESRPAPAQAPSKVEYPKDDINPEDIPF